MQCLDCSRVLEQSATSCRCGWVVPRKLEREAPHQYTPRVSHEEARRAYERVRPSLAEKLKTDRWTRERVIEHWREVAARPGALPVTKAMAAEALMNLGAGHDGRDVTAELARMREAMKPFEREPGMDDELMDRANP